MFLYCKYFNCITRCINTFFDFISFGLLPYIWKSLRSYYLVMVVTTVRAHAKPYTSGRTDAVKSNANRRAAFFLGCGLLMGGQMYPSGATAITAVEEATGIENPSHLVQGSSIVWLRGVTLLWFWAHIFTSCLTGHCQNC